MITKLKILSLIAVLFVSGSCEKLPEKNAPDKMRVMFTDDPATTVTIAWNRYESDQNEDRIYFDTQDHGSDIDSYKFSKSPDQYTDFIGFKTAFVKLEELTPNTRYYFLIVSNLGHTQRYFVETLPDSRDERISVISGGDSRNNRVPRQAANSLVAKLKPHFVFFGGDMTSLGTTKQWSEWFDDWQLTIAADGRVTPIVPARGNHEYGNTVLSELFGITKSNYYSLKIAGGLIQAYTLNSEVSTGGTQFEWLQNEMDNNTDAFWKIVQYHKPMRPHVKSKKEGTSQYNDWVDTFYDNSVDLIFESDAHTVKSTWPIRPTTEEGSFEGFIRDDVNGMVFVGEGCWGAPIRDADDIKPWTRESGKFNQFKWVFFDQDKIELRTVKVDNAAEVGSVDLNERFLEPAGIDLWETVHGKVMTITK
jgi:hypothetical protein